MITASALLAAKLDLKEKTIIKLSAFHVGMLAQSLLITVTSAFQKA